MNNLLFTALILALLYYFFFYRPQQKKLTQIPPTLFETKATQTEEYQPEAKAIPDPAVIKKLTDEKQELLKDIQQKEKTISGLNNSYQKLETKTQQEIAKLKEQLHAKDNQIKELMAAEKQVDHLLKNLQDLNQELD